MAVLIDVLIFLALVLVLGHTVTESLEIMLWNMNDNKTN